MARIPDQVHEVQGLYGPFTLAERVVQKIWMRLDFDLAGARLEDGRRLEIRRPGSWNLLAGPDFRGARLAFDGRELSGDVEVHFHAADWRAHGHDSDPAYDNVVLHVVMFPPSGTETGASSRRGEPLPTLVLLPLLNRGLEEYASDDALENLTDRDVAERLSELSVLPAAELRERLRARAQVRWAEKVGHARRRLGKLGWQEALHHAALEVLGYRHNRAPMLAVAARHPLPEWSGGLAIDELFLQNDGAWQIRGVRPANHPRQRLRQYAAWVERAPDWPQRVGEFFTAASRVPADEAVAAARRHLGLAGLRERVATGVTGGMLTGSRLDNLVCDGLLPLVEAASGADLLPVWFNWYVGDVPREVRRGLVALELAGPGTGPQCHGWAQGLLAWIIERDARASG